MQTDIQYMICMQAVLWKYLIQREHVYENVLTDMLTTSNNVGKKIHHKNYFMPFILIVINIVNKNGKQDGSFTGFGSWPIFKIKEVACLKMDLS